MKRAILIGCCAAGIAAPAFAQFKAGEIQIFRRARFVGETVCGQATAGTTVLCLSATTHNLQISNNGGAFADVGQALGSGGLDIIADPAILTLEKAAQTAKARLTGYSVTGSNEAVALSANALESAGPAWNRDDTTKIAWLSLVDPNADSFIIQRAAAAANPITWTTLLTVDNAGSLFHAGNHGVGRTAASARLHVGIGGTGTTAEEVRIDSGSGAAGHSFLSLYRNAVLKAVIGVEGSAANFIAGSAINDLAIKNSQAINISVDGGTTNHINISSLGFRNNTGRILTTGSAPTIAGTGMGTTATYVAEAGSSNQSGTVVGTTGGTGITTTGSFTVTFAGAAYSIAGNIPVCVATLMDNTNAWNTRATFRAGNLTSGGVSFFWDNNAVAPSGVYGFSYHCFGK